VELSTAISRELKVKFEPESGNKLKLDKVGFCITKAVFYDYFDKATDQRRVSAGINWFHLFSTK
jgi:hypothetical protein